MATKLIGIVLSIGLIYVIVKSGVSGSLSSDATWLGLCILIAGFMAGGDGDG